MAKLTTRIRESMAGALVAYRFLEEAKALARTNADLLERVYTYCYSPEVQAAMAVVDKAFPVYLNNAPFALCHSMQLNVRGARIALEGTLTSRWGALPRQAPTTRLLASRYFPHPIEDEALAAEIVAHAQNIQQFHEDGQTAYMEALSVLNGITTTDKLGKAWPEAMPVVEHLIPETDRTLPVVQVAAINTKFRLPPKEKEDKARASQLASNA